MYSFQIAIHARPPSAANGELVDIAGQQYRTLTLQPEMLGAGLQVSFEETTDALAALPRMFVEPDGSFVWVSAEWPTWQLDGCLYDRGGKLLYVDLKGTCPREEFDQLLSTLGWPDSPLIFQLVRQAVFLDEAEFRRFAAAG